MHRLNVFLLLSDIALDHRYRIPLIFLFFLSFYVGTRGVVAIDGNQACEKTVLCSESRGKGQTRRSVVFISCYVRSHICKSVVLLADPRSGPHLGPTIRERGISSQEVNVKQPDIFSLPVGSLLAPVVDGWNRVRGSCARATTENKNSALLRVSRQRTDKKKRGIERGISSQEVNVKQPDIFSLPVGSLLAPVVDGWRRGSCARATTENKNSALLRVSRQRTDKKKRGIHFWRRIFLLWIIDIGYLLFSSSFFLSTWGHAGSLL
jgi:hypothetical protein